MELLDCMAVLFSNFWGIYTIFDGGCTNLHSHQECIMGPFSPHPVQHLLFLVFLKIAILIGVRRYYTVVWLCISLMTSNVEHLFMCLLVISKYSNLKQKYVNIWWVYYCCFKWINKYFKFFSVLICNVLNISRNTQINEVSLKCSITISV